MQESRRMQNRTEKPTIKGMTVPAGCTFEGAFFVPIFKIILGDKAI